MHEIVSEIYTHLRMVWRRRWFALVIVTLVCLAGAIYVGSLPDTFRVFAKVHVDTRSLLGPALRGLALSAGSEAHAVAMMQRTLLVRPNLEAIARATDMDLQAKTPEDMERLIRHLKDTIEVGQPRGGQEIFTIAYVDRDPKLAKRVVDAVMNLILERSLGESRQDTTATQDFLEVQIKDYQAKLEEAEARLEEFKRANFSLMPGSAADYFSRREAMEQTLRDARLQLQEATNRRNALREQLEDSEDASLWMLPGGGNAGQPSSPLDGRIQELEARVDQLLINYTEKHPDVILAKRRIEDLKAQRQAEWDALAAEQLENPTEPDPNVNNPVYQGLRISMTAADAEVAALQGRVAEYQKRYKELQRQVDESLQVESEFKRLNRDYGVLQSKYKGLVERREATQLGQKAEQSGETLKVKVIEPPIVPVLPTGPNRLLLGLGALVIGLGTGVGLAWLLSLINPVYFDSRQLTASTGLPLLGTVSMVWSSRQAARPRLEIVTFVATFTVVLILYAGMIAVRPLGAAALDGLFGLGGLFS